MQGREVVGQLATGGMLGSEIPGKVLLEVSMSLGGTWSQVLTATALRM